MEFYDRTDGRGGRRSTNVDLVAGAVLTAALLLFVTLGGMVVPNALRRIWHGTGDFNPTLSAALTLNVAMLLFGWIRFKELQRQTEARAEAEERVMTLASRDYTTGLYNRAALSETGQRLLAEGAAVTLIVMDLDHFKKVNDHYGHAAGDDVLKGIAAILTDEAPANALCARLGGDEFAVLLTGDPAETGAAFELAERILNAVAMPLSVDGGTAQVSASIGISDAPREESSFSAVLRRSDIAMYQAKKRGRNCIAWFDAVMEAEVRRLNQLEADMRVGIPSGEFVPFYQPQYSLESGRLHGFEVLARWYHPTDGVIEPTEFIALAEGTGLIASLSLSVMRQALIDARGWDASLMIAVNVSPVQLKDPLLDQRIVKILTETGFPAQRLELEVTESALFEDLDLALSTIESLKAVGITISLDDFGTGYSSLAQLQALPFDRIKIDRSFVLTMLDNQESAAIVTAIASLANSLKLPVTAEGIESHAVGASLRAMGCSEGQGWHYGRPLGRADIGERFPEILADAGVAAELAAAAAKEARAAEAERLVKERRDTRRRGSRRIKAA